MALGEFEGKRQDAVPASRAFVYRLHPAWTQTTYRQRPCDSTATKPTRHPQQRAHTLVANDNCRYGADQETRSARKQLLQRWCAGKV